MEPTESRVSEQLRWMPEMSSRSREVESSPADSRSSLARAVLIFLTAALLYAQADIRGKLVADAAGYLYAGQQMVDGVPPYVSFFDIKTPVGVFLCAGGVSLGRLVGADDVLAARAVFFVLSCFCVVSIYYLVLLLFRSRWQAVFSSVVFLCFPGFGIVALSGPMPKTVAVTLVTASLAAMVGRRWFWASLLATLAGLTWQPTGAYALAAILLAWWQTGGGRAERRAAALRASLRASLGALLPVALVSLYFLSHGALYEFIDGALLAHLESGTRSPGFVAKWHALVDSLFGGLGGTSFVVALGLLMVAALYVWRWQALPKPSLRGLAADRFAPILLTFPLPLLWTPMDFQAYPDLFIFLPYAAIGFGWLLSAGVAAILEHADIEGAARELFPVGVAVLIVVLTAAQYDFGMRYRPNGPHTGLADQRRAVEKVLADYGQDARVVSVGVPQAMALLERRNPSRFLGPTPRFAHNIEGRVEGGFAGWLDSLRATKPDIVFVQRRIDLNFDQTQGRLWSQWVRDFERIPDVAGWEVLVAPNAARVAAGRASGTRPGQSGDVIRSP